MFSFIKSFLLLFRRLKKYKTEVFLLTVAFFIAGISAVIYMYSNSDYHASEENDTQPSVLSARASRILVDIAGAVERPGVYQATPGARLKDLLIQAGGLSAEAERKYIARNFNLAKVVTDQEKIYVPSQEEVAQGIFAEPQKLLDYTQPVQTQIQSSVISTDERININSATLEELDTLTGIGKVTAQKIIQNRPYKNVEELVSKKVMKKNVFEKIKELVSTN